MTKLMFMASENILGHMGVHIPNVFIM